jgi:hypothetical protein
MRLHPAGLVVDNPPRRVNSLYLDTPGLSDMRSNVDGLRQRSKLRWRWYGDDWAVIHPYLELKRKRYLLNTKIRCLLPCRLDMTQPWSELLDVVHAHVGRDWQVMLQTLTQPTLLAHYQREYYATLDRVVRVTLDYDQAAYDQRMSLRPNLHVRLPIADTVVIEVKADREQEERAAEVIEWFPLSRTRNSKYASGLHTALYSQ